MTGSDVSVRRSVRAFDRLSRYDLILAVIPAAFLVAVLATPLSSLPVEAGVAVAATVGVLAVVDALFVNPPTEGVGR